MTITIGAWIIPALLSALAILWCSRQNYRGDYNMTAVFTLCPRNIGEARC